MLGLSGLGTHSHSTLPLGPTSAVTSRSERNPYSAIGGNGLRWLCSGATSTPCGRSAGPGNGTMEALLTGGECSPLPREH